MDGGGDDQDEEDDDIDEDEDDDDKDNKDEDDDDMDDDDIKANELMMMTPPQFQRISGESWAEHDPWAPLHTDCKPPSSKKIPSEIYGGSTALYAAYFVDIDFTVDMV